MGGPVGGAPGGGPGGGPPGGKGGIPDAGGGIPTIEVKKRKVGASIDSKLQLAHHTYLHLSKSIRECGR